VRYLQALSDTDFHIAKEGGSTLLNAVLAHGHLEVIKFLFEHMV